jgi:uncharacterized membrane protein
MKRMLRWIGGGIVLLAGVWCLALLQMRYDEADIKKAIAAISQRPGFTHCSAVVISRLRGQVKVQCDEGRFVVDVVKGIIGGDDGREM